MTRINIKNVLIGGVLIFSIDLVISYLVKGLPVNSLTVLGALVVLFLVSLFVTKFTLDKPDKNSIVNGFLQGIVSAILMIVFASAYSVSLIISIVGSTLGGYLVSKRKK